MSCLVIRPKLDEKPYHLSELEEESSARTALPSDHMPHQQQHKTSAL